MEAGQCLLTRLPAAPAMAKAVREDHQVAPTEPARTLAVLLPAVNAGVGAPVTERSGTIAARRAQGLVERIVGEAPGRRMVVAEAQTAVRGAGQSAKVSAAAPCSRPRSRDCQSRPSPTM